MRNRRLYLPWIVCTAFIGTLTGLTLSTPTAADDDPSSKQISAGFVLPAVTREAYLQFAGEKAGQDRDDNDLKMKLVWCPPGMFTMEGIIAEIDEPAPPKEKPGIDKLDNDDEVIDDEAPLEEPNAPPLRVEQITRVKTFLRLGYWLGKYEVTQAEWTRVMGTEPWIGEDFIKGGDKCPATYVSWDDAIAFCRTLTEQERKVGRLPETWEYTLPTEAQWERACRARSETRFCFGDDESKLGEFAWYVGNAVRGREKLGHRVGQRKPNPWGLYDMHGNVWEWCLDRFRDNPPGGFDPFVSTGSPSRVFRGGSWDNSASQCRSTSRKKNLPSWLSSNIGFRVALSVVR